MTMACFWAEEAPEAEGKNLVKGEGRVLWPSAPASRVSDPR